MTTDEGAIDLAWIRKHVDTLLELSKQFPPGSAMQNATLTRAGYYLDLVEAWQKRNQRPSIVDETTRSADVFGGGPGISLSVKDR